MQTLHRLLSTALATLLGAASLSSASDQEPDLLSQAPWDSVERGLALLHDELGVDQLSPPVRDALRRVPRHRFVPAPPQPDAYENRPLAIGHGQTISQPLIVAMMTELLGVESGDRVLELGTGSGYQAAVLAEMSVEVCSVEIVPQACNG